jgi:hypothetical protein
VKFSISCTIVLIVAGLTGCSGGETATTATTEASASQIDGGARAAASYFQVGDCIETPFQSGSNVTVVDCAKPHALEVFGVHMLPEGNYPGSAAIQAVKNRCAKGHLGEYSAEGAADPSLTTSARFPDQTSWGMGDRSVTCLVNFRPPRTGSIRDH